MKFYNAVALLILAAVFCSMPALAVDKYVGGSPEITAYIAGVNQFSPGQDATITVILQNSGTNTAKFTSQGTLADDDLATTAKLVTVGLSQGTAPVVIKTDPQSLGDIKSPGKTTATSRPRSHRTRRSANTRSPCWSSTSTSPITLQTRKQATRSSTITPRST